MVVRKIAILVFVAGAATACERRSIVDNSLANGASGLAKAISIAPAQPAGIEGTWTLSQPFVQSIDGAQLLSVTEMRQTYAAGGAASFEGQFTITDGGAATNFRISGTGTYSLQGATLTERMTQAVATPEVSTEEGHVMAQALSGAYSSAPPTVSDVEEVSANSLRLRNRETGRVLSLTR